MLLKISHVPIALSLVEGCTQSPRSNVLHVGAGRDRPYGLILRAPRL